MIPLKDGVQIELLKSIRKLGFDHRFENNLSIKE